MDMSKNVFGGHLVIGLNTGLQSKMSALQAESTSRQPSDP